MAEPLTHILFGQRWIAAAELLPPLALAGALRAIITNGTATFAALGAPALRSRTNVVAVVGTYLPMMPLAGVWGLRGVAVAVAVGQTLALVPFTLYARSVLGLSAKDLVRHLLPGVALVVIVGVTILGANRLYPNYSVKSLAIMIGMLAVTYAGASTLLWMGARRGPLSALMLLRSGTGAAAN